MKSVKTIYYLLSPHDLEKYCRTHFVKLYHRYYFSTIAIIHWIKRCLILSIFMFVDIYHSWQPYNKRCGKQSCRFESFKNCKLSWQEEMISLYELCCSSDGWMDVLLVYCTKPIFRMCATSFFFQFHCFRANQKGLTTWRFFFRLAAWNEFKYVMK